MRIAVVGAGIAGLRAAQLLEKKGAFVQIFEARDRVGGRLQTVSLPEGGFYEAGGEWIDSDHRRVLSLLDEFGLKPEPSNQQPGLVVCEGSQAPEDQLWPDAASDAEALHRAASELCETLADPVWDTPGVDRLDLQTLDEFIEAQCSSPRGRWWARTSAASDEGEDPESVGLLGWLAGYRHYLDRQEGDMSSFRVPGGLGALCEKMASSLNAPVYLGHALRSVDLHDEAVELWFEGEMGFFDRALLTLPPAVLQDVDFGGALPIEKEAAWSLLGSSRAIKVALRFSEAWWGSRRRLITDLPCCQVWESGRDGALVLCCYVWGDAAEALLSSGDPAGLAVRSLAQIDPKASQAFVEGWVHDWISDPWSLGAFTHLPPASVMGALPHLAPPVGRLHFAGEYTAQWMGFVEGALESAERAVEEMWS